jgi:4-alpha-glucanotransferase
MSTRGLPPDLDALARFAGVQPEYRADDGSKVVVDAETVVAVLAALGLPVTRPADAAGVLVEQLASRDRRVLEPVLVHRDGDAAIAMSLGGRVDPSSWSLTVTYEDGRVRHGRLADLLVGRDDERLRVRLPAPDEGPMPPGYHDVVVEGPGVAARALLISAPRCPKPERGWGVFMPLYALRSDTDWGAGSYPDLAEIGRWTRSVGGSFLAVLPLYPTFLDDEPIDPSPYLPVTRLGFNDLYVDPVSVPELAAASAARQLLASPGFGARVQAARRSPTVPYEQLSRLRREVIGPLADELVGSGRGASELRAFAERRPDVFGYAKFRATGERHGRDWRSWGAAISSQCAALSLADPAVRYHLCAQWLAQRQLADAAGVAPLYCDLPIGVHPMGFDPFWEPGAFAPGAHGGAPPDAFYAEGQDWTLPPMHPIGVREQRYRHLIEVLRVAFAHVTMLRVDHVMGLHRLYWIPSGHDARHGAYVSYHAEELRALVALEAHRAGAVVVGEDLGTIDPAVRAAMADDRMLRSWVFEFETTLADPLPEPPDDCIASVGSHDLPRFAAFFRGAGPGEPNVTGELVGGAVPASRELERRRWREALANALGSGGQAPLGDGHSRQPDAERAALAGCLAHLAASPAALVLVDLQDLWGELEQDNRPGTGIEAGNWRHRSALDLDELRADAGVAALCSLVDLRRELPAPTRAAAP